MSGIINYGCSGTIPNFMSYNASGMMYFPTYLPPSEIKESKVKCCYCGSYKDMYKKCENCGAQ